MAGTKKPLWTYPKCGYRFVTRNMWHSCSNYSRDDHFKDKDHGLVGPFKIPARI